MADRPAPPIIAGRAGAALYWHVGDYFLTAYPSAMGWEARVRDRRAGTELLLDGLFAAESDAVAWCRRMAAVFAEDQAGG
jgi:hypothetical protein